MSKAAGQIPLSYDHCTYCELPFTMPQNSLGRGRRRTRDHFFPTSKGGKNSEGNIFIVCQHCNSLKGNFLPNEFLYWLRCKIEWKEYPMVYGITYNEELLKIVKKNVRLIYDNKYPSKKSEPIPIVTRKKIATGENKERVAVNGVHYVNFLGKECPCVGFTDTAFGYGTYQYQNAYYHSTEEKYVFVHPQSKELVAYHKSVVEKHIKPFFPGSKKHEKVEEKPIASWIKTVTQDVHLSVNDNTARRRPVDKEYSLYLQRQTPEQFALAEKFGWKIAKLLTDPEPSFHE